MDLVLVGGGISSDVYFNKNTPNVVYKMFKNNDPDFFLLEIEILQRLNHPNVVKLINYEMSSNTNRQSFITFEKYDMNLEQYLKTNFALVDSLLKLDICYQLSLGLAAIHEQNILHFDIKPDNILVNSNLKRVVISDFGLSIIKKHPVKANLVICSPAYRPLECYRRQRKKYNSKVDVFSLGCVYFEIFETNCFKTLFKSENDLERYYVMKKPLHLQKMSMEFVLIWIVMLKIDQKERISSSRLAKYFTKNIGMLSSTFVEKKIKLIF